MKLNQRKFTINLIKNQPPILTQMILHYVMKFCAPKTSTCPVKWVKFNKYKHKKSSWITQGLLNSIKYRDKLYKRLKLTDPNSANDDTININLKTYNGILKTSIRAAKQTYFELRFIRFKNDIKNTWKLLMIFCQTKIQKKITNSHCRKWCDTYR